MIQLLLQQKFVLTFYSEFSSVRVNKDTRVIAFVMTTCVCDRQTAFVRSHPKSQ